MNQTIKYYEEMKRLQALNVPIDWQKVAANMAAAIADQENNAIDGD